MHILLDLLKGLFVCQLFLSTSHRISSATASTVSLSARVMDFPYNFPSVERASEERQKEERSVGLNVVCTPFCTSSLLLSFASDVLRIALA